MKRIPNHGTLNFALDEKLKCDQKIEELKSQGWRVTVTQEYVVRMHFPTAKKTVIKARDVSTTHTHNSIIQAPYRKANKTRKGEL